MSIISLGVFLVGSIKFSQKSIKNLGLGIFLLLLTNSKVDAHTVHVSEDVAATFHIEPHHNPKAGEPSQTWFALTRKGGKVIPLEQCNCKLAIYSQQSAAGSSPLLEVPLKAISAEQYQGIPGADIVFPKAGIYQLQLSGTPKTEGNFKPFELKYEVTVGSGSATPAITPQATNHKEHNLMATEERSPLTSSRQIPAAIAGSVAGLGILGLLWRRFK